MTALEEFDDWMQRHDNNYLNDFGVIFNRAPDFLFVDAPWPGHEDMEILSIVLFCVNGLDLYQRLDLATPEDLANVQPEDLLQLYHDGRAMILCTTKDEETLTFEKAKDGTLIAIVDGQNIGHDVQEQLLVPGDFIRYTERFFRFLKTEAKRP